MDSRKLGLLLHTLKHLRFKQLYFRGYYLIRNRFFKRAYKKQLSQSVEVLAWEKDILYTDSYKNYKSFEFLNLKHTFSGQIDWNYSAFGKLWTYNLNYFDFLNQHTISPEIGLGLIEDYIKNDARLKDGKEPYPISLRGINWIKFLSKHSISNPVINQTLFNHYQTLFHNLEYHLLGNHLLENGYSLFFGAYYFKDEILYKKAAQLLKEELGEQILKDGAHFELSPMYHQILLHRLLDCINLVQRNAWKEDGILAFLQGKAIDMIAWLQEVTFSNGNIPMVNDSAYGIAPTSSQIFEYSRELGLTWPKGKLSDSGYRKFRGLDFELFTDMGDVGPTYQPGHAHSDTFNFELYVQGRPVIVDTGISTYEKNGLRQEERETAAHNTVKIGDEEQTRVWGGFRVAQRAKVFDINESKNQVNATHDGYRHLGINHTRSFKVGTSQIIIDDSLDNPIKQEQRAFFHFHPSIKDIKIYKDSLKLVDENINIKFDRATEIVLQRYDYATGFNKREESRKIVVSFQNTLRTQIQL